MDDDARLLREGLALDPDEKKKRAALLTRMGDSCRHSGDLEAASAAYAAALESHPMGATQAGLGHLLANRGQAAQAQSLFKQAAESLRTEGHQVLAIEAESNVGCMLYAQNQHAAAVEVFEHTLPQRRAHGDVAGQTLDLLNLAGCRLGLGDPAAALPLFAEAIPLLESAGDTIAAAKTRLDRGNAAYQAGEPHAAVSEYQAALAVLTPHLSRVEAAQLHSNLGSMLYEVGEVTSAQEAFDAAERLLPEDDPQALTVATHLRANRGLALIAGGRFDEARADLEQARDGYSALGEHRRVATTTAALSDLCRYDGDLAGAVAFHSDVIVLERDHGFSLDEPGGLLYAPIEDPGLAIQEATGEPRARTVPRPSPVDLDPHGERPVLFFTPPVLGTYGPLFPRGATTVATYLASHGIPAVVIPLSHCVDIYGGGEHVASMTREAIREAIAAYRPRAVGVSVTFSYLYAQGLEIARLAREADADVPILMGGPHVTYQDRECLEEAPFVDIVVRGEGEWTALETLRTLEAGGELKDVLGITWRDRDGAVHKNKRRPLGNVLELPAIDFGLLPRPFVERMEITGLTSRGCKFKCTFCHEFRYWGTVVRDYPPQRVVDELERIATIYGNTMRGIDDSMLSMLEPSYFELCELLAKSPHKSERFNFLTRIDTVSSEGLEAMKKAGIPSMSVGLESGSTKVLKAMNKGFDLDAAKGTLRTIRDAGVGLATFFIVGHPGDDTQESEKTIEYVDELFREDLTGWIDLSIFTPYPGTPFFINPKAYGIEILSLDWSKWRRSNRPIAQLTNYSASEIYLTYLRMLETQAGHHARKRADPHVGLRQ